MSLIGEELPQSKKNSDAQLLSQQFQNLRRSIQGTFNATGSSMFGNSTVKRTYGGDVLCETHNEPLMKFKTFSSQEGTVGIADEIPALSDYNLSRKQVVEVIDDGLKSETSNIDSAITVKEFPDL